VRTANGPTRSCGLPSNSRGAIVPTRVLTDRPKPPHSMPPRLGLPAAPQPPLALPWDRALSFCGCFFRPNQIKPEVHVRRSCADHFWEQSGCIQEKEEGWGCNSSPHEHHSKCHTKGSGSPLDGFPGIYSSAVKLCAGAELSSRRAKLWLYCSSADLP